METIEEAAKQFLSDQYERLSKKTFDKYDSVIDIFLVYLNNYGYLHLDTEAKALFEKKYSESPEAAFTGTFGLETMRGTSYSEFFEYFLVRKFVSSESFMKSAITVMKKWTKWLYESDRIEKYKQDNLLDYFQKGKSKAIPNAIKVSDLLYKHATNNPIETPADIKDGMFTIIDMSDGKLWLEDMTESDAPIGPVVVPKHITRLCEEGWDLSGVLGKEKGKWYILECYNVYPSG